jgi:hypothetical protein
MIFFARSGIATKMSYRAVCNELSPNQKLINNWGNHTCVAVKYMITLERDARTWETPRKPSLPATELSRSSHPLSSTLFLCLRDINNRQAHSVQRVSVIAFFSVLVFSIVDDQRCPLAASNSHPRAYVDTTCNICARGWIQHCCRDRPIIDN